jgi:hypothetical protein
MESAQHQGTRLIDDLAKFEEFREAILPALRVDLRSGLDAKAILTKYKAVAAARLVSTIATERDSGKATSAAKEILDRTDGKAKETKDITHRMADMSDEQIDAVIASMKKDLASDG